MGGSDSLRAIVVQINRFILVTIARRMERGGGRLALSFFELAVPRVKIPTETVYSLAE